jgi:glycosyltransferase involved in cell wall biosynthesis
VGNTAVSPAYTHRVTQQIKTAGLTQAVPLHGPLPDETLANYLAASHLLVVPSSYEGFGIVYLEGMAFGLPAMAGTEGAAHEIITDGSNGFLVRDSAVLAQRLATLQQNRHQLAQMSLAAHRHFLTRPGWEENMSSIRPFLLHNG